MKDKITWHRITDSQVISPEMLKLFGIELSEDLENNTPFKDNLPKGIKKVIFQKSHTIILWSNGEKTCVKCSEEEFDREKGLAMAICKKLLSRNKFKRLIDNADYQDK